MSRPTLRNHRPRRQSGRVFRIHHHRPNQLSSSPSPSATCSSTCNSVLSILPRLRRHTRRLKRGPARRHHSLQSIIPYSWTTQSQRSTKAGQRASRVGRVGPLPPESGKGRRQSRKVRRHRPRLLALLAPRISSNRRRAFLQSRLLLLCDQPRAISIIHMSPNQRTTQPRKPRAATRSQPQLPHFRMSTPSRLPRALSLSLWLASNPGQPRPSNFFADAPKGASPSNQTLYVPLASPLTQPSKSATASNGLAVTVARSGTTTPALDSTASGRYEM